MSRCEIAAMHHSQLIRVKRVKGKGRGVFARRVIKKGTIIERVPVLVIPVEVVAGGRRNPVLSKYFYEWSRGTVAVSLGYGSLYNHSYAPNADYEHGPRSLTYRALRDIEAGEEVTVNYNGRPSNREPVGFEVI